MTETFLWRRVLQTTCAVLVITVAASTVQAVCAADSATLGDHPAVFDGFDGAANSAPDGAIWDYDVGRWQTNGQLQEYTSSRDNIRVDGAGHLIIEARSTESGITSGRLVTRHRVPMLYGTLSARIKMPTGKGISPSFWLVGTDIDTAGWPDCGEIDLVEMPSSGTYRYTTLHGPWTARPPGARSDYQIQTQAQTVDLSADFHTYWVVRAPGSIVIGMDGTTFATFTPESLSPDQRWVFDHPMYAILNVAVGDDWAGPPDETTSWPATMVVDWFRWEPAA
ncbi:glycoside hydrolase family 16 protein [Mycolicibacterium cosmeticum]|uniref:glycoside hydrolase family 16 protein n=1 Tax=Mycolicibacterium cosmeticum TaxID=258533 RepID=UPI003204CB58